MNGFANGIMSILLGWIRVLISDLWKLMTSPDGDALYRFLSEHWKTILLVTVLIGLAVDLIVYFLRWRPDYIWASRRAARRNRRERNNEYELEADKSEIQASHEDADVYGDDFGYNPYERPRDIVSDAYSPAAFAPEAPTRVSQAVPAQSAMQGVFAPPAQAMYGAAKPAQVERYTVQPIYSARGCASGSYADATAQFAPMARTSRRGYSFERYADMPQESAEPVFDEPPRFSDFTRVEAPIRGDEYRMPENPAHGMVNSFGSVMPEPAEYLRDMHAGFAPQLAPERIYPPNEESRAEDAARTQVHPGLNSDAFRQSFGLDARAGVTADRGAEASEDFWDEPTPTFTPYAQAFENSRQSAKRNPIAAIAKKARNFVGGEDDEHRLTIHDLQPTVDMRTAFHEPVYPRSKPGKGEEL